MAAITCSQRRNVSPQTHRISHTAAPDPSFTSQGGISLLERKSKLCPRPKFSFGQEMLWKGECW